MDNSQNTMSVVNNEINLASVSSTKKSIRVNRRKFALFSSCCKPSCAESGDRSVLSPAADTKNTAHINTAETSKSSPSRLDFTDANEWSTAVQVDGCLASPRAVDLKTLNIRTADSIFKTNSLDPWNDSDVACYERAAVVRACTEDAEVHVRWFKREAIESKVSQRYSIKTEDDGQRYGGCPATQNVSSKPELHESVNADGQARVRSDDVRLRCAEDSKGKNPLDEGNRGRNVSKSRRDVHSRSQDSIRDVSFNRNNVSSSRSDGSFGRRNVNSNYRDVTCGCCDVIDSDESGKERRKKEKRRRCDDGVAEKVYGVHSTTLEKVQLKELREYVTCGSSSSAASNCPTHTPSTSQHSSHSLNSNSEVSIFTELITLNLSPLPLGLIFRAQISRDSQSDRGVYVHAVQSPSAASLNGRIQPGDLILEVNGLDLEPIGSEKALAILENEIDNGGSISLLIGRYYVDSPSVLNAVANNYSGCAAFPLDSSATFVGLELVDWVQENIEGLSSRRAAVGYVGDLLGDGYIRAIGPDGFPMKVESFSALDWFTFTPSNEAAGMVKTDCVDDLRVIAVV